MGGGTQNARMVRRNAQGLSPRGRGNLLNAERRRRRIGSIPAWAGEPPGGPEPGLAFAVYPRVGGGTRQAFVAAGGQSGLSPRGRGNRPTGSASPRNRRSIPAWAGEPRLSKDPFYYSAVYPRVGGGTAFGQVIDMHIGGLSPRGRGNPDAKTPGPCRGRSIPAWAGEPRVRIELRSSRRVYPRVGGGTPRTGYRHSPGGGLSPRGRGNRR